MTPRSAGHTFAYKRFARDSVLRPIIPIEVWSQTNNRLRTEALIDSGADFCVFHGDLGDALGIDVKKGRKQEIGGVGGKIVGYRHNIGLIVGTDTHNADVVFTYDLPAMGFQILGQISFFDKYAVKFDYQERSIVLRKKS